MAQILTFVSLLWAALLLWYLWERLGPKDPIRVSIHLDHVDPGAQLLCEIKNTSASAVTLTHFAVNPRHVGDGRGERVATIPLPETETLRPGDTARVLIDVDWQLLAARTIAVCDSSGLEHRPPAAQLTAIQNSLHERIDHRVYTASARDWLFGAANLAFGVVILGLGFFMLMWVIATG